MSDTMCQRIYPVDACILKIGKNDGWASFMKLYGEAPDCPLWFMIGARRIGKTDLALQIAIMLWQEYRRKTMWIRDVLETLKSADFQADFLNDAYKYGWISDVDEQHKWTVRNDGIHDPDGELFIKFQSLSTYSSRRGPAHPDVDLMLFDEFIPEDRRYFRGALKGLMSLTKTVFSGRPGCRCICTSNFVALSNPYFAGFEIYPDPKRDVSVWHDKAVAIERCRGYKCAIAKDSPWNKAYAAAHYGEYADEGEDQMHELIRKIPKGSRPDKWAVMIYDKWYRIYTTTAGVRIARRERDLNRAATVLYVTDPRDLTDDVRIIEPVVRMAIDNDIAAGRLRYEDANTLFAFVNLIYNI